MTLDDLKNYKTVRSAPVWGSIEATKSLNPLPGGGVMIQEMLQILEHFDLRAMGHTLPTISQRSPKP